MGILMRHEGIAGTAEAVDETQAVFYESKGWVRLDATEVDDLASAAIAAEDAVILGRAESLPAAGEILQAAALAVERDELVHLTNDELRDLAHDRGVSTTSAMTKADLIAAIEAGVAPADTEEP